MLDLQNKKNNASAPKVAFEILYRANIRGVINYKTESVRERFIACWICNFRLTSGQTSGEKNLRIFYWLKRTAQNFRGDYWGVILT